MASRADKMMSNHVYNSEESEDLRTLYSDFRDSDYDNRNTNVNSLTDISVTDYTEIEQAEGYKKKRQLQRKRDSKNAPRGGFPPIYVIDKKKKEEKESNKTRQFITKKTGISILDILKKKKAASNKKN